jgi:hypothetical protein
MALAQIKDLNGPPEEVARRIEQAKKLSELYDSFIAFDQEDSHDRPPGIHASDLYPCARKAVYAVLDIPKKNRISKFWKQRFKVGHAIHDMVQKDFHKMARQQVKEEAQTFAFHIAREMNCRMTFEDEAEIKPSLQPLAAHYNIHSSCDGIFSFFDLDTDELVLRVGLEAKSKSQDEYAKLKVPEGQHARQAIVYMACLDLPLMWFFYMNKSNQNNTNSNAPWLMVWQPELWNEVAGRCSDVLAAAAVNELPPREVTVVCEFCPWAYTCQPPNVMKDYVRPPTRRDSLLGVLP